MPVLLTGFNSIYRGRLLARIRVVSAIVTRSAMIRPGHFGAGTCIAHLLVGMVQFYRLVVRANRSFAPFPRFEFKLFSWNFLGHVTSFKPLDHGASIWQETFRNGIETQAGSRQTLLPPLGFRVSEYAR